LRNAARTAALLAAGIMVDACNDGGREHDDSTAGSTVDTTVTAGSTSSATSSATDTSDSTSATGTITTGPSTDDGPIFDVGADTEGTTGDPVDLCKVADDMDALGPCEQQAPPDSFDPEQQWAWTNAAEPYSYVTPLVANFTDDNDDGEIDLCDVPDVLAVAALSPGSWGAVGHIYLLDGATGAEQLMFPDAVEANFTPAIGDIDGDGLVEVVTVTPAGALVAFEHDGAKKWEQAVTWGNGEQGQPMYYSNSIALADLDNDGDVEILSAHLVFDHLGNVVQTLPKVAGQWGATTAADLDGDDDLEVVLGNAAYHHDGTMHYVTALPAGYPQVADLDDDGAPEVLITNNDGLSLLEANGTVVYQGLRPTNDPVGFTTWLRPATIHDFDGDGTAEYAVSSANHYTVYEGDAGVVWSADVSDFSGIAAGTAFDFLGDGVAEAMYADEQFMFVFDGQGQVLLQISRKSGTLSEYPTVADIDNDGSAEILVVSNAFGGGGDPCVQAIRDVQDRWIQARRIWNQHTYHVTNVREDGTIPQIEPHHWELLNTFRTNAQIEAGGVCQPEG
jgi:hypothetical protein